MPDLSTIVKAYDVRGLVPDQLDPSIARALGAAFARVSDARRRSDGGSPAVVVGYDMRPSSPGLVAAFAEGVLAQGVDVIDIGLASTDQLYFASGHLGVPGAMFTASHNPARYNGIKMCRAHAVPLGVDTGLTAVRDLVADGGPPAAASPGRIERRDLLADYARHLLTLAPVKGRRLRVVVD